MGAVTTKKKSNAGKNVFVFFMVFIILEMLIIFGISKVFKNKDVTPSIGGYSIFMTKEDLYKDGAEGMEVAVPKNVLVIASNGLQAPSDKIGTAVLCENVEGVGTGVFYLASVDPLADETGVVYTVANGAKYYTVRSSDLVGSTSSYYSTAGKVINFVTKKFGMIVCAVVPLFLMVFLELIIAIATHSSDDDEEDEDDEEEEEHKDVKLDDFLFGGQNEGEQIAKQRRQQGMRKGEPVKQQPAKRPAKTVDFDDFAPPRKQQQRPQQAAQPVKAQNNNNQTGRPQGAQAPKTPAAPAQTVQFQKPQAAVAPAQKANIQPAPAQTTPPPMPAREQTAAPAPQAAVQENAAPAPKPRKRKRLSSVSAADDSANASLEELMKLMEEEQNKLKNQIK